MAETTGGTTSGNSTKPISSAENRGWNIQMPRPNMVASAVAIALDRMPMRRLSRMLWPQAGLSINA